MPTLRDVPPLAQQTAIWVLIFLEVEPPTRSHLLFPKNLPSSRNRTINSNTSLQRTLQEPQALSSTWQTSRSLLHFLTCRSVQRNYQTSHFHRSCATSKCPRGRTNQVLSNSLMTLLYLESTATCSTASTFVQRGHGAGNCAKTMTTKTAADPKHTNFTPTSLVSTTPYERKLKNCYTSATYSWFLATNTSGSASNTEVSFGYRSFQRITGLR